MRRARQLGQRKQPDPRPRADQRGYDAAWSRTAEAYKAHHPICEDCELAGLTRLAVDVHHKVKISVRPDLRLDWSNLRALCRSCHNRYTSRGE